MNRTIMRLKILIPVFILFCITSIAQQVTPKTALQDYIDMATNPFLGRKKNVMN